MPAHHLYCARPCNKSGIGAKWQGMMAEQGDGWGKLLLAANAGDARSYAKFLQAITPVLRGIVRAKGVSLGEAGCEDARR